MHLEQLTTADQIKPGDLLILSDGTNPEAATVKKVLTIDGDETEVVIDLKRNRYFNVGMYLRGMSWVRVAQIVRMPANT